MTIRRRKPALTGARETSVRPQRILILHTRYRLAGGEDRVFNEEAEMLRLRGHDVDCLELSNDPLTRIGGLRAAATTVWNRTSARALQKRIAAFKPDVVHVHNDFPWTSPSVYPAAARTGAAVVLTLHNFRNLCVNGLFFRDGRVCEACLHDPLSKSAIRHACYHDSRTATAAAAARRLVHTTRGTWRRDVSLFLAPTALVRDRHVAGGFPAHRMVIKPHFVRGNPAVGTGRGGYALFVGRLMPDKGLDRLLEAWRDLPGMLRLRIVGDGPLRDAAEAAAADPARRIDLLGPQPPDTIHGLLQDAAFAIVPSPVYESFGRVVVEAFAAGTPVLAPDHGSPGVLIDHGTTGWTYRFDDPDALHHRLAVLLADPQPGAALRPAARTTFESRFTEDANYVQLIAAYEKAIANARR